MKITKDVVEVLKYHGYMTFTESTETFLKRFDTVEELGDAGFITDRGAIDFLRSVFDENGVNHSAEVTPEELEAQAEIITQEPINQEIINPEFINPEPIVEELGDVVEEPVNEHESDGTGFIEVDNEPITESGPGEEHVPGSDGTGFIEADNEPVTESGPGEEHVPESDQNPTPVVEEPTQNPPEDAPVVDPTPKKTTKKTTKKSTKKES